MLFHNIKIYFFSQTNKTKKETTWFKSINCNIDTLTYPHADTVYPAGVHARVAIVPVAVKIVVVDVEVVVSQYNKNLPSLLEVAVSSAPDSSSASDTFSKGLSG